MIVFSLSQLYAVYCVLPDCSIWVLPHIVALPEQFAKIAQALNKAIRQALQFAPSLCLIIITNFHKLSPSQLSLEDCGIFNIILRTFG